jgi:S1/P1 Nuclease
MLRPSLVLSLAFLLIITATGPAWAWGRLDHRVIAKLAQRHLTNQAKAEIKALLEPSESLADCSTWADEHRREMPKTAPYDLRWAPIEFGVVWAAALGTIGLRLRRLAADEA